MNQVKIVYRLELSSPPPLRLEVTIVMMMVSPRVIGRGYRSWRIYVVIALRALSSFLRPLPINVSGDLNFGVWELGSPVSGFQLFICTRPISGTGG